MFVCRTIVSADNFLKVLLNLPSRVYNIVAFTFPQGDKEDSIENRRVDAYRSGSRSPPYEDTNDHHYGERPGPAGRNDERRSPGYGQETRYGDSRKSPVDDWRRDDRFGNGRRSEERRFSDGESKLEVRSPDSQKDLGLSSPPLVRPVRDILGEDGPSLRIGEPPKANGGKVAEGFTQTQVEFLTEYRGRCFTV